MNYVEATDTSLRKTGQIKLHGPAAFAGMRKGGRSGPLLTPGNPNGSLIGLRINTQNILLRMPKNKPPLSQQEIQTIGIWIGQGAHFDGADEQAMLADVIKAAKEKQVDDQPDDKPTTKVGISCWWRSTASRGF